ncbi:MAG: putative ATP-dependent endonuclease of OLD family [Roseivirga sp.]|jgi:predicted ATP-dependent endonuclease of OLD family
MKLDRYKLRNFRRLERVEIDLHDEQTVFVGSNNTGKTSATTAFKLFLKEKNKFSIWDFHANRLKDFDLFVDSDGIEPLPEIHIDLWFSISKTDDLPYRLIAELLPTIENEVTELGVKISFGVKDSVDLLNEYNALFPEKEKSLSQHLSDEPSLIKKHFHLQYFVLSEDGNIERTMKDGPSTLNNLIEVNFLDAQRHFDDNEQSRSAKLSGAYYSFYKNQLQQKELDQEAKSVINANNDSLTRHYEKTFDNLHKVTKTLGAPTANDRVIQLISNLKAEEILKGNVELKYFDPDINHSLPEAYNGLGYKNLIYIAIQVCDFYLKWQQLDSRPPVFIVFIEEPEVHLHAQVQQVFVSNIISALRDVQIDEANPFPQIVLTTHSSHIINEINFENIRYFRRVNVNNGVAQCSNLILKNYELNTTKLEKILSFSVPITNDNNHITKSISSEVRDLAFFSNAKTDKTATVDNQDIAFLQKYLRLTHCDLFFADAAILVEGAAEKLLTPSMIEKSEPSLKNKYLTVLEVGGAYAHKFISLLNFLNIPYLIITDIDSVSSSTRETCEPSEQNAITANATIKSIVTDDEGKPIESIKALEVFDGSIQTEGMGYLAYQKMISISGIYEDTKKLLPRTLEDAIIYTNLKKFIDKELSLKIKFDDTREIEADRANVFKAVNKKKFPKTEFALDLVSTNTEWETPNYIKAGFSWLAGKV